MFKLTVLYNLPPDMDAEEFVRWRTTTHQEENAGMPGVIKTDFYIAVDEPDGTPPRYRYITEVWWETGRTWKLPITTRRCKPSSQKMASAIPIDSFWSLRR